MKNADDAIENVLAGLRQVEAAPGLEQRVQDGVRRRMAHGSLATGEPAAFLRGSRRAGLGLGFAAMLLVLMMSARRAEKHHAVNAKADDLRSTVAQTNWASTAGERESVPQRLKPPFAHRADGASEAAPVSEAGSFEGLSGAKEAEAKGSADTVSFPAPPLPLTEQERLLLRVANHGGPEEVAMLDPAARAIEDVKETMGFLEFFGRPERVETTIQKINQGESR